MEPEIAYQPTDADREHVKGLLDGQPVNGNDHAFALGYVGAWLESIVEYLAEDALPEFLVPGVRKALAMSRAMSK